MENYLWGVFLTLFCWEHHLKLARVFQDLFLATVPHNSSILELASGHGAWGVWALTECPSCSLVGIDLSPASVKIARGLAKAAGVTERSEHREGDAMTLASQPSFESAICGFVVEHLDQPELLFEALASQVVPGGRVFLTGALTAAQEDHVYEFQRESELVQMAEQAGFRVVMSLSEGPEKTPRSRIYLPRSQALIMERKRGRFW
jgi:ubiquinone/menaquinone biosynthesis C-methylase UbiE